MSDHRRVVASVAQSAARQSHNESMARVIWRSWVRASPGAQFFCSSKNGEKRPWEKKSCPSSRIRTSDLRISAKPTTVLRSTNWAIKGTWRYGKECAQWILYKYGGEKKKRGKSVAADGFDPSTSGLWAQHASTAPRCCGGRKGKLPNVDEKKEKKKKKPGLFLEGKKKASAQ